METFRTGKSSEIGVLMKIAIFVIKHHKTPNGVFSAIRIYYPIIFILGTLKELEIPKMLLKFQIDIPKITCFYWCFYPIDVLLCFMLKKVQNFGYFIHQWKPFEQENEVKSAF